MKGEYELPEISSDIDDGGDEWEFKNTYRTDKGNLKGRFENFIRKDIPKELRKAIKETFVNELKSK